MWGILRKRRGVHRWNNLNFLWCITVLKPVFSLKNFAFYLLLGVILFGLYGVGLYRGLKRNEPRLVFRFFSMTGIYLNLLVVFISTIIIDGDSDLVRHLFLVSVFLDFLLLQIVSDVIGKRMWQDTTPQVIGEVEGIEK